eukprot:SAG31_NODE_2737_length_5157_cov_7.756869_3_plen_79_part_00
MLAQMLRTERWLDVGVLPVLAELQAHCMDRISFVMEAFCLIEISHPEAAEEMLAYVISRYEVDEDGTFRSKAHGLRGW